MMEQYSTDLLHAALWIISSLGAVIVVLLGTIAAIARWGGLELFRRLRAQDAKLEEFQRIVTTKSDEIKDLLSSEVRMLHEEQGAVRERVVKLEAFKDQMQAVCNFGRRHTDTKQD